jgi:hypothetical protein
MGCLAKTFILAAFIAPSNTLKIWRIFADGSLTCSASILKARNLPAVGVESLYYIVWNFQYAKYESNPQSGRDKPKN